MKIMGANKIGNIINEEFKKLLNELIDPNGGNLYQPQGLNPSVVKLFEDIDDFYQSTLNDKYWKEISKKFPDYNTKKSDTIKAVNFILAKMKNKYPEKDWDKIELVIRNKIYDGIT